MPTPPAARKPEGFDPFAPETLECPHAWHAALREHTPVCPLPQAGYVLVTRHEDIERVALDTETYSSNLVGLLLANASGGAELLELPEGAPRPVDVLAIADPPAHGRQRRLVNKAFSPRRVAALEPRVRLLAAGLFDSFAQRRSAEWVSELAVPLPMTVICELLGLPQADARSLEAWSNAGVALLGGTATPAEIAGHVAAQLELQQYLLDRFRDAKAAPGDDVIGDLVRATREQAEALTDDEAVSVLVQLVIAGQETTASLIASAALLLSQDATLQARLRAEPHLVAPFIEEVLRLESPFNGHFRLVTRDTMLGGVALPKGTRLMLVWASGNRDEERFPAAETLDVERVDPRGHLAFGHGVHHCIGASLARMEARVSVETLLAKTITVRLLEGSAPPVHRPSLFVRRLSELHLGFELPAT
jgi:cytochrome P450 family 144